MDTWSRPEGVGLAGPPAVSTSARPEAPRRPAYSHRCPHVAALSCSSVTPLPARARSHHLRLPGRQLTISRMVHSCYARYPWP